MAVTEVAEYQDRKFDRSKYYDERSRDYPIRALFRKLDAQEPRSYTWGCEPHLDQGPDGACVGFSFAHEAAAKPQVHPTDYNLAMRIYRRAQQIDEWTGEDYDGTSVLAGAKVMKELGYFESYYWALTLEEMQFGVSRKGPGVLGCWWWSGMMDPDENGYIHPTGKRVGGHAILVKGYNVKAGRFEVHQSWGDQWGQGGDAYISDEDMEKLLLNDGEFCLPVRTLR